MDKKNELACDPFRDVAVSRRGLFAALAIVAGLGAVPARSAIANELYFNGQHITPGMGSFDHRFTVGDYINFITHPDRNTGVSDYGRGYACGWVGWVAADANSGLGWSSSMLQALHYSLCLLVECDWSNDLYDHIKAHPFMACGDINRQNDHRMWHNINTNDNHGLLFRNNGFLSTFQGDMLNTGAGPRVSVNNNDWIDVGYDDYAYTKPEFFMRRGAEVQTNTYRAEVDINMVMRDNKDGQAAYEKDLRSVTGNIDIDTETIRIRNDQTLYGGIFELAPVVLPDMRVDVGQGVYDANGRPVTNYDAGRGLVFWGDYTGINQMWLFKPYLADNVGAWTFALASLIGPGLTTTLNNANHVDADHSWAGGGMACGYGIIHELNKATGLENSWWIDHEPADSNETDHKCYFITSDADGQRLDTNGATAENSPVRLCGVAKPGEWGYQVNAQWYLHEARCSGTLVNDRKTATIGDKVTCIGFMPDSDDTPTLKPSDWLHNVTNRKDLPPQPMYRWYVIPELVEMPEDDDAVIMATCSIDGMGAQIEAPAHRHIGYPFTGHALNALALRLDGSKFAGSICYGVHPTTSQNWTSASDGQTISREAFTHVRIWLTGEIAENYDLCYRAKLVDGNWTDTVYSCGHADNNGSSAPAIGDLLSKISALNVHLVRKPRGARVVKEFSFDDTITVTDEICAGDDAVWLCSAAMMGLTTVSASENYIWTDRLLGTVCAQDQAEDGNKYPYPPVTRLACTVHFMMVDTLGETQQISTVNIRVNDTFSTTGNAQDFADARTALEKAMRDEGQDVSLLDSCMDGWYEGDKDLKDQTIFQKGKFSSKKLTKDLYLWNRVKVGGFMFFKDGLNKENVIYTTRRLLTGTVYTIPKEVTDKELEQTCNLNDRFGTDPSTGFSGWHLDKTLTDEQITSVTAGTSMVPLYGRNRCTLRCEYAPGSVVLSPDWDMRVSPETSAEAHPGFIPTFTEPTHKGYDAKGKEFALAPIADSGEGHTAYYFDELARVTVPATAYRNIGGGQWRTYQCEAWLDDGEAATASEAAASRSRSRARAANAFKMTKDTVKYIRWTEVVSDGVVGVRRK